MLSVINQIGKCTWNYIVRDLNKDGSLYGLAYALPQYKCNSSPIIKSYEA